jgi:hypothetical protein
VELLLQQQQAPVEERQVAVRRQKILALLIYSEGDGTALKKASLLFSSSLVSY